MNDSVSRGAYGDAYGRWRGLGPYYATFPVDFAKDVVTEFCPKGGKVLDPFCGRGTVPFVAQSTGRRALGIDSNPVAWVFSKAKTDPEPSAQKVSTRLDEIARKSRSQDRMPRNEFQKWAWHPRVLCFLNSARRNLAWSENRTDRTLMAFILTSVHAKIGDGVSNQMPKIKALGPDYSVRWWRERNMSPPEICPVEYLRKRIAWRYEMRVIGRKNSSEIVLGPAEDMLCRRHSATFDMLFTSPPYLNVTSYLQDSWIRLWMLNKGPAYPIWDKDKKIHHPALYKEMMTKVFQECRRLLKDDGNVWIRTDFRQYTRDTTRDILKELWGAENLYWRRALPRLAKSAVNLGEVDYLISDCREKATRLGFRALKFHGRKQAKPQIDGLENQSARRVA